MTYTTFKCRRCDEPTDIADAYQARDSDGPEHCYRCFRFLESKDRVLSTHGELLEQLSDHPRKETE